MKLVPVLCLAGCLLGTVVIGVLKSSAPIPPKAAPPMAMAAPVVFYVAPDGSDTATGTKATPFATLDRARLAIRELKQKQGGTLKQPISVVLRAGTYFLSKPLAFTPEDSGTDSCPITYSAQDGANVVISGGRQLGAWRATGDGLWHAKVTDDLDGFRRLRIGDNDEIRARTPNFDPKNPRMGGWWLPYYSGTSWDKGAFGLAVTNDQEVGTKLSWKGIVPAAGNYNVWFRYGQNMLFNMGERTTLRVDNGAAIPLINLPDTGDWNRYAWSKAATLSLNAGEQTLTWENVRGGGINLDAFVLSDDPNWTPADASSVERLPPSIAGKHQVVIQGEAATSLAGKSVIPRGIAAGRADRIGLSDEQLNSIPDSEWGDAEVNVFPAGGWVNARLKVNGVDRQDSALLVKANDTISEGNRFYIENVRSGLDSAGEWYVDKAAGEVLYKPRASDRPQEGAVVPTLDRLVTFTGNAGAGQFVENIRFKGLTFSDTDYTLGGYYSQADSAIWMQAAQKCGIENCTFQHLGGYAVRMEQRSNGNSVVRCSMNGLGGGGVVLLGDTKSQAFNNLIAANEISDCGKVYAHVAGIYATSSSGNQILNNSIQRMPRYGVSLKSYDPNAASHDNVVAYNEIIDTNLETNDSGAIETLGRDKEDSGNRIEYNLIRNVVGLKVTPDGVFHSPYFVWGIYLDDWSSGTTVKGNVVDGTTLGGVCIHGGKDNSIENNVFLNGSEMNIRLQPRGDGLMHNNTFSHNIVTYKNPAALLWFSYPNTWNRDVLGEVDNNVYWNSGGLDLATAPRAFGPPATWAKWQGLGLDGNSVIANPMLKDDYSLKAGSPATQLGFQALPLGQIGPKGYTP
ncbi:hypothetical protein EON83_03370 [bacterium]|nr:MAG: hypothetical protein EON83_03370 [bacterium]